MDDVQKSRIRIKHWIDHNIEHVKGYLEVADILEKSGHDSAAEKLRQGVRLFELANESFQVVLTDLPETEAPGDPEHTHEHCGGHHCGHGHGHTHDK
jgi:hypothetical protein